MDCERAEAAYWLDNRGYTLSVNAERELKEGNLAFLQWLSKNKDKHEVYDLEEGIDMAANQNNMPLMR